MLQGPTGYHYHHHRVSLYTQHAALSSSLVGIISTQILDVAPRPSPSGTSSRLAAAPWPCCVGCVRNACLFVMKVGAGTLCRPHMGGHQSEGLGAVKPLRGSRAAWMWAGCMVGSRETLLCSILWAAGRQGQVMRGYQEVEQHDHSLGH